MKTFLGRLTLRAGGGAEDCPPCGGQPIPLVGRGPKWPERASEVLLLQKQNL